MTYSASQFQRHFFALLIVFAGAVWLSAMGAKKVETPRFNVPEVGVPEAKALLDAGATIINVRATVVSEYGHIPGALLIPLAVLRAGIPPLLAATKDKTIVVYCGDGVKTGPEATHILRQAGYSVVNMKPGVEAWSSAGLPVSKT